MDGTLVDTEPYWFSAQQELLARYGIDWSQERATALIGSALEASAHHFRALGVPLAAEQIISTLLDSVSAQTRARTPWRAGAKELLLELRDDGIGCALVTMSRGPLAQVMLDQLPGDVFEVVVTGEMVERGKPHPAPYLLALRMLSDSRGCEVPAHSSVAIEDSIPGVQSALAAGLRTLGVPNMVELAGFDSLAIWPTLQGRHIRDLVGLLDTEVRV